ncbi:endopolyphosphatase, partial [Ascoidea rubescens DSM 1968]
MDLLPENEKAVSIDSTSVCQTKHSGTCKLKKLIAFFVSISTLFLVSIVSLNKLGHLPLNANILSGDQVDRPHNINNDNVKVSKISKYYYTDEQLKELESLKLSTNNNPVLIEKSDGSTQVIHGRFLHITDLHPDPHYVPNSSFKSACHRGEGQSSKYGDAILGCDSPLILVEDTIDWVEKNLKDKIDFIVWTGDNVRHDNDRAIPRYEHDIFELNQNISNLFYNSFKNKDSIDPRDLLVKLIPSLGNNDVYPHNLFSPGPTLQSRQLWKIWERFVSNDQYHVFENGVYFFSEIIPNHLAVLSINTLFLFKSNPLVDNCDNRKQPGYKLFTWLGVTLKELRRRNMKVWMTGHVPPIPKNYDYTCYNKYVSWTYEYRDIIIGGLYGHMNIDHFVPLDALETYNYYNQLSISKNNSQIHDLKALFPDFIDEINEITNTQLFHLDSYHDFINNYEHFPHSSNDFDIMGGTPVGKVDYMDTVRKSFYSKIKSKKADSFNSSERYSIVHITASVIPTFNPGIRIWEYNISGLDNEFSALSSPNYDPWPVFFKNAEINLKNEYPDIFPDNDSEYFDHFINRNLYDDNDDDDNENYDNTDNYITSDVLKDPSVPPKKPDDIEAGPAYNPQLFTPLKYAQYYLDLESINKGKKDFGY